MAKFKLSTRNCIFIAKDLDHALQLLAKYFQDSKANPLFVHGKIELKAVSDDYFNSVIMAPVKRLEKKHASLHKERNKKR